MIKECLVKLNNEFVTVVAFGDIDIQFPSIHKNVKTVFVNFEDGKYFIVDKYNKSKDTSVSKKKNVRKKTTVDEVTKEVEATV